MNINIQLDFNKNSNNSYQGINQVPHASTEASIDIATISNYRLDKALTIDSSIVLTPYDLSFVDFMWGPAHKSINSGLPAGRQDSYAVIFSSFNSSISSNL